jgi:membrane protease subunit HflC
MKMKNTWVLILVLVVSIVFILMLFSYQVRETEKAVVYQFGEPIKTVDEPGFKWKLPRPIQKVVTYDIRGRMLERTMEETTTRGGEPIIVTSYVVWHINDPQVYQKSLSGNEEEAKKQLTSILGNTQNEVVGAHDFSEFVNTDASKIQFEQIENEMMAIMRPAAEGLGIDIMAVGIKKLSLSKDVTQDVFERMKADRKRKTENILSSGRAVAKEITSDAERKQAELLAFVNREVQTIEGEGIAEAAKYYQQLETEPELAMFLWDLESLKRILKEKATVIIGAETEPFKLLREMPEIKPGSEPSNR